MSSSAATTFNASPSAPVVKDKKKLSRKTSGLKQAAAAAAAVEKPATATATVTSSTSTPEMEAAASTPPPPPSTAAPAPSEPEQHVDGDVVDSAMRKLKGTRPDLLRTSTYYEGAKGVYMYLAGLPVLSGVAPTVEAVTESLINMTPLKPSPEEQAEQKSVAVLDKRICEALSYADEVVDVKKDEAIEGIVSVKKHVNTLGPVKTVVGTACQVGDGVGKAYGSANDTVGNVWQQVVGTISDTYTGVTSMATNTVNTATSTAGSAVKHVTSTTGNVVNSAKSTAGTTVDGVKSLVGSTAESIGTNVNWATSSAMSLINAAIAFPMGLVQSIMGKSEAAPEE
eukprot:g8142.t1